MSSEHQDFQFELNETLYFDSGDEVLELLGIALHPEVTIHSYDSYVSIRGEIELRGEYIRDESRQEMEEAPLSLDDLEAKRYIEQVEEIEGNTAEFFHRFPVDISVPAYRVERTDDIRIDITDFDYEFPLNSKLQLSAVAEIKGIKADVDLREVQEEQQEEQPLESFAFEVTREENQFEEEEAEEESLDEESSAADTIIDEEEDIPVDEEIREEVNEEASKIEEPKANELKIRAMEEQEGNEEGEANSSEEVKDVSYLTDIFREEEEERFTKMKICIVQEDDTIESIAERFQVSTLQLIKQNKLDDDFDINEGQLLYIPKK